MIEISEKMNSKHQFTNGELIKEIKNHRPVF